jgi:serine/threonine protein kinase/Tol biopolymer transport system component
MSLTPGTHFGSYRILSAIGAGGMGEVYKAHDTRLHRDVAVKVLSGLFASDRDRLARFEREAQVLATLNHPNIAQIYGVADGPADASQHKTALVMELVDGPTLAEVIAAQGGRGQPLESAWPIARQIADALDAAHGRGIVHRDLKPANIKVAPDGTVKVLDFGLAKAVGSDVQPGAETMNSPTTLGGATAVGVIMGTAAYMSPEQARGRPIDARADIWAFGAVLFELLTGRPCFARETVSDTVAAVLTAQPDWSHVPATALPLLRRCLEKDPKRRLRDIGDVDLLLESARTATQAQGSRIRIWLPWSAAGILAVALAVGAVALRPRPADRPLLRFDLDLGEIPARSLGVVAFSPDGTRIVTPVRGPDGRSMLATRRLDQSVPAVLQGTEGADQPFFSPDGQWIAFFAANKLKKVPVQGGTPAVVANVRNPRGGSWADDGTIVVALTNSSGLSRIGAEGGAPEPLTTLTKEEITHRWPQVLPGNAVLFTANPGTLNSYENATIDVQRQNGQRKTVWRGGYHGRFIPTDGTRGHLVFAQRGMLYGVRFDADRLEVQGTPVQLLQDVASDPLSAAGRFDFSRAGSFAFRKGASLQSWTLSWLDGTGNPQPLRSQPTMYYSPRFSRDGRRLAVSIDTGKGMDIFIHDIDRDTMSPLTFTGETNADAVWSPDGAHVLFRARSGGTYHLFWARTDGAGEPHVLMPSGGEIDDISANALSPDGRRLIYSLVDPITGSDLWTVSLDRSDPDRPKAGQPHAFIRTAAIENRGAFSHDGRWVAYASNESGTLEVYVRPFATPLSGSAGKWQISTGGGAIPIWSGNGRELFYLNPEQRIMVVDYVVRDGTFVAGKPRLWSDRPLFPSGFTNYDLAPDGKRFAAVLVGDSEPPSARVTLLLNFFDELRRRLP